MLGCNPATNKNRIQILNSNFVLLDPSKLQHLYVNKKLLLNEHQRMRDAFDNKEV